MRNSSCLLAAQNRWTSGLPPQQYTLLFKCARAVEATIRDPLPSEFDTIRQIALSSFPVPEWLFAYPENCGHYAPECRKKGMRVLVAENKRGRLAGYIYFECRGRDEIYVKELAARPAEKADTISHAGVLLLAEALQASLGQGRFARTSLNVIQPHRVAVPGVWRDPVPYYEKFGYSVVPGGPKYRLGSYHWREDTWMSGDVGLICRRLTQYLKASFNIVCHDRRTR